jgi:sucrose-6-phosphate hydrolase SacC (GH32 family)
MEHVSGRPVDLRSSFHAVEWIDGPRGEPLELHVFVDHSVVEVFVDDREAFSSITSQSLLP